MALLNAQSKSEIIGLTNAYCFQKTERDEKVISFLYENGYALATQLMGCGFFSKHALTQRLSLLRKAGLIRSKRVGEYTLLKNWVAQVAYRGVSKEVLDLLRTKVYFLNPLIVEPHYKRSFLFDEDMIRHQLGLGLIRNLLKAELGPCIQLSENRWASHAHQRKSGKLDLIPDLVMISDTVKLAVEYERTLKSKNKYLSKWDDYDQSEFTHILYFAESPSIFEKLKNYLASTDRIGLVDIEEPQCVYKPRVGFLSFQQFLRARFV